MGKQTGAQASVEKTSKGFKRSAEKEKRQGTIAGAFAAAAAAKADKKPAEAVPVLEVEEARGTPVNNYDSQNIRNTLAHHLEELGAKRRWVPEATAPTYAQALPQQQGRPSRRQRSLSPDGDDHTLSLSTERDKAESRDWSIGDDDACRYLCQLRDLTSSTMTPTKEQLHSVVKLVRAHGLHGRKDISSMAFILLQLVARLHPSVTVRAAEPGSAAATVPCVVVNSNAWTLMPGCDGLSLDPFDDEPDSRGPSAFQFLSHLLDLARACVQAPAKPPARSTALTSGDLLLLKWLLSELDRDLGCRLAVFRAAGGNALKERREALLRGSQLWRAFSGPASKTSALDRKELVRGLMLLIAAPADGEGLPPPTSAEDCAFDAAELAALGQHFLMMLLELYGAAEGAGMFLKHGASRTTTSGALENVRMVIDTAMLEGLVGSAQILPDLTQKRAFLLALPPRDRMRLLAMIVAKGHARRRNDSVNYPGLERMNFLYTNHGDVGAYVSANAREALQYISDDLMLAFNLVDKTADGLALLVASLAQASASELPGEEIADLKPLVEQLAAALRANEKGSAAKKLSPAAELSLAAAQRAVAMAC